MNTVDADFEPLWVIYPVAPISFPLISLSRISLAFSSSRRMAISGFSVMYDAAEVLSSERNFFVKASSI